MGTCFCKTSGKGSVVMATGSQNRTLCAHLELAFQDFTSLVTTRGERHTHIQRELFPFPSIEARSETLILLRSVLSVSQQSYLMHVFAVNHFTASHASSHSNFKRKFLPHLLSTQSALILCSTSLWHPISCIFNHWKPKVIEVSAAREIEPKLLQREWRLKRQEFYYAFENCIQRRRREGIIIRCIWNSKIF